MPRSSTRINGSEPIQVIASPLAIAPGTKKPNIWKKLFSRKKPVPEPEKQKNYPNYTNISQPIQQQAEVPRTVPRSVPIVIPRNEEAPREIPQTAHIPTPVPARTPALRTGKDDTARPNTLAGAPVSEVPKHVKDSRRRSFIQTLTKKKSNKELQDRELQNFYAAKENEEKGLMRQYREENPHTPRVAAYVPKHAAADLYKTTGRPQHAESNQAAGYFQKTSSRQPYVDSTQTSTLRQSTNRQQSAESDQSATGLQRSTIRQSWANLDEQVATPIMHVWRPPPPPLQNVTPTNRPQSTRVNTPLSVQSSILPLTPPSPTRAATPEPAEPSDETRATFTADQETDFQNFLRESRIAQGPTRGHEDFLSPTPRRRPLSGAVMDNIMANRHSAIITPTPTGPSGSQRPAIERQTTTDTGISKKSAASKATKQANRRSWVSFVKPSKPVQGSNPNRYSITSIDDWGSMNGSIYKSSGRAGGNGSINGSMRGDGKKEKRRSMAGSLKRALSTDRDRENDERMKASKALAEKKERRKSKQAPVGNPALDRYNQAVMVGRGRYD